MRQGVIISCIKSGLALNKHVQSWLIRKLYFKVIGNAYTCTCSFVIQTTSLFCYHLEINRDNNNNYNNKTHIWMSTKLHRNAVLILMEDGDDINDNNSSFGS